MGTGYLTVERVSKTYRTAHGELVEAVHDISFTAEQGEFLAIVGPSGCGKSTLLRMIAGALSWDQGIITVNRREVRGEEGRGRPVKIGMVFQKPSLFAWQTVLGNVLAPIRLMGLPTKPYEARARQLLEMAGLRAFEHRYPAELSGGMQQRAAICRALIHDPDLLLMDEPFAALDAMTRDRLNMELLRLWEQSGKTVVFVTHNIQEAVFLADRVLVLSQRPARLLDDVRVGLPRPRTFAMRTEEAFGRLTLKIYEYFGVPA